MTAIRPATAGDAAAIVALVGRLAAFEGASAVALTEEVVRRDLADRFEALVAEEGGRVLGVAVLVGAYSSWAGRPTLIVHDLFVAEEARGTGAGRSLLAAAARLALARGCCRLDVNVLGANRPAQAFYQALGFRPLADWLPYRLDEAGLAALASAS